MSPPDVFLGPVCEYVISPVAKYAGVWNIPLMTAAAQADGFTHKQPNYPLLTRMMGSYRYTTSRTNGATCLLVYYRSLSLVFCYLITRESCASLEDHKLDPTAVQPQTGSVETKCPDASVQFAARGAKSRWNNRWRSIKLLQWLLQ